MSKRCEFGVHAFRHVSIEGYREIWSILKRCKRCGLESSKYSEWYPWRIRTYDWSTQKFQDRTAATEGK